MEETTPKKMHRTSHKKWIKHNKLILTQKLGEHMKGNEKLTPFAPVSLRHWYGGKIVP